MRPMDRSKAPRQPKAADTMASVQAFAGSILNKHRPGRGRDKLGSASMLHVKPKGEAAGVQQRIHIHVTPPRAAEKKVKRITEEPKTVRIIEREKVKVEHKTIVVREIVRIMDHQRTARALAMTAPVQLEASSEQRQSPDAAASTGKREAGSRRQDYYSGSQPAASPLVTALHKELSKPVWQSQTVERLRRILAAGAAGTTPPPLRRNRDGEAAREAAAGAHVTAKRRPLTHARRTEGNADAEQTALRETKRPTRAEQAAKHRAEKAAEVEQSATRRSEAAAEIEQKAKRRTEQAVEAEQKALREVKRVEQAAKRRAEQTAGQAAQDAEVKRQAADIHKKQANESNKATAGVDSRTQKNSSDKVSNNASIPPSNAASRRNRPDAGGDSRVQALSLEAGNEAAGERLSAKRSKDVLNDTIQRKRHVGRLLSYNPDWKAAPWLSRERKLQQLARPWLSSRLPQGEGGPAPLEQKAFPIQARKLIHRERHGLSDNQAPGTARPVASEDKQLSEELPSKQERKSSAHEEAANIRISWRALSATRNRRADAGNVAGRKFPELLTAKRRSAASEAQSSPIAKRQSRPSSAADTVAQTSAAQAGVQAQSRPVSPASARTRQRQASHNESERQVSQSGNRNPSSSSKSRQENSITEAALTEGHATIQRSPNSSSRDSLHPALNRHASVPIVAHRAALLTNGSIDLNLDGGVLSSKGKAAPTPNRYATIGGDEQGLELRQLFGGKEPPAHWRSRFSSLVLRRSPSWTADPLGDRSNYRRAPGTKNIPIQRSDSMVNGTNSAVSQQSGGSGAKGSQGINSRGSEVIQRNGNIGVLSNKTTSGVTEGRIGRGPVITGSGDVSFNGTQPLTSRLERSRTPEASAAYKPIGLVLRRLPESFGARLVRMARSNQGANVTQVISQPGRTSVSGAGSPAETGSTTASRRNRQAPAALLIGRRRSVIQAANGGQTASSPTAARAKSSEKQGAPSPTPSSHAGQSAAASSGLIGLRNAARPVEGAVQPLTSTHSTESRLQSSAGASPQGVVQLRRPVFATQRNEVLQLRKSAHTASPTDALQRRMLAATAPRNGASQRRTLVQRAAASRNTPPLNALPGSVAQQSLAAAQRANAIQRSPLVARALAAAEQQSAAHAQPAFSAVSAGASTLTYGRSSAAEASSFDAAQQPFATPAAGGGAAIGLTHRTPPAAPAEPPRQVQVEAPRELEPEKLQRMIMKMPQLNPEAIADRVYKALERKMKLEQRRNGF